MAIFNSPTFGTISGRHGSAVATTTKRGKTFLRIFRQSVDAKTEKQVAHRNKFAFLVAFLYCMRELLNFTFKTKGGYNYAFALAMKNAVTGIAPDFGIDYGKLTFTEGSLKRANVVSVTKTEPNTLKVEWNVTNISDSALGGARGNEQVNLVLYNEGMKEAVLSENVSERSAASAEVLCPDYWAGEMVHCWIYFTRPDGKMNSASEYAGSVVL